MFEGLLPSYYNHKKFLSFVRQLNFYGEYPRAIGLLFLRVSSLVEDIWYRMVFLSR